MKKHLLSILLVIALIIGMVPITAYAEEPSSTTTYGSFIDGAGVLNDLLDTCGENVHPRIIMTEEKFDALRAYVKDGEIVKDGSMTAELLLEFKGEADMYLNDTKYSTYDIFTKNTLETAKKIQRYIATLALAFNIFGDEDYAKRAYVEIEYACSYPNWNPHHFLDPAEMCAGFAYGYDWLYDWLNDDQKALMRKNMIEKGLNRVMNDYLGEVQWNNKPEKETDRSYVWYESNKGDNWTFVCTGGMNLAALAIIDEDDSTDIAEDVLTYGFKKAYTAVRQGYSAIDGTYVEGLGYWDYATYYLGLQSSALITATGQDYGLTDYIGIEKSVDFVRYMSSNYPYSFSFGDDGDSRDTGWSVFLWLGEHFNSPELSAIRIRKIKEDKEFRFLDILWIDESKQVDVKNDKDTDWGAIGSYNASFRNTWDISGIVAALHVGENDYTYHGHFDLGSFYLEYNGSRFFTDLGNENYSLDDRKYSYRIKPEGHNTLVLNPSSGTDQADEVTCVVTEFSAGNEAYAITDLTEAYKDNDAKSVTRGLMMIKDKECVVIQDEISLNKAGEIYWFAHSKGLIDVAADGRSAIITVGSDRMWVGLLSEGGTFTVMDPVRLSTSLKVDGVTENIGYHKLAVHLTNTKDAKITVACIPLKNGQTRPSWTPSVTSFSEWSSGVDSRGCSLSISDTIGLNVYAKIRTDIANTSGASMSFTIDGKETLVPISSAKKETVDGEELYKFTIPVAAAYMTSKVTTQFKILKDGKYTNVGGAYTYSVRSYADAIRSNPGNYSADTVALVNAMLSYGGYAQQYFGVNTGNLANKNLYNSSNDPVLNFGQNLSSQNLSSQNLSNQNLSSQQLSDQDLTNWQLSSITTKGDLVFCGSSLVCNEGTSLKLYFGSKTGAALASGRYTVKATTGGKTVTCSGAVGGSSSGGSGSGSSGSGSGSSGSGAVGGSSSGSSGSGGGSSGSGGGAGGSSGGAGGNIGSNMYVVTINNITASGLDNVYTFTITDTKNSSYTFTFNYSPMNYIANAQASSNNDLVNLTRALYLYNQAANKCF